MIEVNMIAAPTAPSFGIKEPNVSWYTCRERFANVFRVDTMTGFYFAPVIKSDEIKFKPYPEGNIIAKENILMFINKIEGALGVSPSLFKETNVNFVIWIEPSSFWLTGIEPSSKEMKMSLFTILLYASLSYDNKKDNFEEALFGHEYIKRTEKAVKRFLFGFTKFVKINNKRNWWVETFEANTIQDIKKQLVSEQPSVCCMGIDNLWT